MLLPAIGFSRSKAAYNYCRTKSTFGISGIYSTGPYIFNVRPDVVTTFGRHTSTGFGYRRDMYVLPNNGYLSFGARVMSLQSELTVGTTLAGFDHELSKFTFKPRYTQLTIPLLVGKVLPLQLYPKANLDVFAGGSVGVCKITAYDVARTIHNEYNTSDVIGMRYDNFTADVSKVVFNATLEAGFQFTPFGTPRLSAGITASYNLLKTPYYKDNGGYANRTQNLVDDFTVGFSRKFVNLLFTVSYSFNKK